MSGVTISRQTYVGTPKQPGADNHAHVVAEDFTHYVDCVFDAGGASEALKASNKRGLTFHRCRFIRGVEDGVDLVACHDVFFIDCIFVGDAGPQDITAKGGCSGLDFMGCTGLRKIVLGNYTIYDGRAYSRLLQLWPTTPKTTDCSVYACGSVLVESWWASRAVGTCRTWCWWPVVTALFFTIRRLIPEKGANAINPAAN